MDADRFDALARSLTSTRSRRSLTRLLGGLSLGGVLGAQTVQDAAGALRNGGFGCNKNSQCKTGKCLGSGKCSCSRKYPTCKQPANRCKEATCQFSTNRCVTSNKAVGSRCPDDGDKCTDDICNGSGRCTHPTKDDGADCGSGKHCSGGVCAILPSCQNEPCTDDNECCSGDCECQVLNGSDCVSGWCNPGHNGKPCHYDGGCLSNNCVGFVCEA